MNSPNDCKVVKKNKKPVVIVVILCAAVIAGVVFGVIHHRRQSAIDYLESIIEQPVVQQSNPEKEPEEVPQENIEIPVDFEELHKANTDIYAWIEIPDTAISYPVLQHPSDDSYYLKRSYDKSSSYYGAVFSQAKYNGKDFSDNCTVLYGHDMRDGTMFAGLLKYMDKSYFDSHRKFYIYMENKVLEYEIFTSIPFDNRNILYAWDCKKQDQYVSLLQTILNVRSVDANITEDCKISSDEKIVILSTCYPGDNTRRYLVAGRLIEK